MTGSRKHTKLETGLSLIIGLGLMVAIFIGIARVTAHGPEGPQLPAKRSTGDSAYTVPKCSDASPRHLTTQDQEVPEVVDQNGNVIRPAAQLTYDAIDNTTVDEAVARLSFIALPMELPTWVSCQVTNVESGTAGDDAYGNLEVTFYEQGLSLPGVNKEIQFRMSLDSGIMPPTDGDWNPVEGHPGWFQDLAASGSGPEGFAGGTRVAWSDESGHFFELTGAVSLTKAIEIGESVAPPSP